MYGTVRPICDCVRISLLLLLFIDSEPRLFCSVLFGDGQILLTGIQHWKEQQQKEKKKQQKSNRFRLLNHNIG